MHPANDKYADQRTVYDDLGAGVLKNAFEGKKDCLYVFTLKIICTSFVYFHVFVNVCFKEKTKLNFALSRASKNKLLAKGE